MVTYNQEREREKIKQTMDTEYENMYPFEIEKELSSIFKSADENKDEQLKQEVLIRSYMREQHRELFCIPKLILIWCGLESVCMDYGRHRK